MGAVWLTKTASLYPCITPPHSLTHSLTHALTRTRTHSHSTTLHPLSLLHPRPTGNRRLSYCVFCKTWLNLINAVDFKQNHIWAEERGRETAERGGRVGEREERRGEGTAGDGGRSPRSDHWEDLFASGFENIPPFSRVRFLRRPPLKCNIEGSPDLL